MERRLSDIEDRTKRIPWMAVFEFDTISCRLKDLKLESFEYFWLRRSDQSFPEFSKKEDSRLLLYVNSHRILEGELEGRNCAEDRIKVCFG